MTKNKKTHLYGLIALILVLTLYVNLPESLFVQQAYQDYNTLHESGMINNFQEIQSNYNFTVYWGMLIGVIILILTFFFIYRQNEEDPTFISMIALILAIISAILLFMGAIIFFRG